MIMSYKNQFYLEAELDEDELTEDEDIEKGLDEDDDDNYDDENGYDADGDDDESEDDEFDTEDPVEEDEPHPMTYADLDEYDDDTSEDEEDDMSDFGSDDSDINNDYDEKDVDILNKLISSETSAVQEYLDANMETSNDNLRRLYVDIANEERFHIEQLMYAKAKLTGEKYEPSDPKVKHEYEELCNSGMDEETAMSTACDKCAISDDKYYTDDSIDEMIDDINDFTESFVESITNNLALASIDMNNVQDVYMEYADMFYMEAIQNVTDRSVKTDTELHPIKFIIKSFVGIIKFIRKIVIRIGGFLKRVHRKDMNKINWIRKHGIKDLFKDGVWMYLWDPDGNHMGSIVDGYVFLDLFRRVMQSIHDSMYKKKEASPIKSNLDSRMKPIKYDSIEDGVRRLRNVVFSKEKVIITDSNEKDLEKMFFGISDNGTSEMSNNFYNFLENLSKQFEELSKNCETLLQDLRDLEGNYNSVYSKNPKLYRMLLSSTKDLTKSFTKFSKAIVHDTTAVMQLNNGLYELMKEYDESKKYNNGENEESQDDIKNGKYQPKKTSEGLKDYYDNIDTEQTPGVPRRF